MSFFKTDSNGAFIRLQALATVQKDAPRSGRTSSGYGNKIPTSYLARTEENGKFRRVYCRIFSNIGHCYVIKNGSRYILEHF